MAITYLINFLSEFHDNKNDFDNKTYVYQNTFKWTP